MKIQIPAAWRTLVYAIALLLAVVLSALVVFGVVTIEQIKGVALGTTAIFAIISPLLALFNITPDAPLSDDTKAEG